MAANYLAYSDLSLDKFSGTDPDQDAEQFIQLIERKINFALGQPLAAPGVDLNAYNFRKKALFSSLLRGPAADSYRNKCSCCYDMGSTTRKILNPICRWPKQISTSDGD